MHEFDGVLKRNNVNGLRLIQFIEQGREGGGFTATRGAGDEHETGLLFGDRVEDRRKIKLVDTGNIRGQFSKNDCVIAALGKHVDAEPRFLTKRVRKIARAGFYQVFYQSVIAVDDR